MRLFSRMLILATEACMHFVFFHTARCVERAESSRMGASALSLLSLMLARWPTKLWEACGPRERQEKEGVGGGWMAV